MVFRFSIKVQKTTFFGELYKDSTQSSFLQIHSLQYYPPSVPRQYLEAANENFLCFRWRIFIHLKCNASVPVRSWEEKNQTLNWRLKLCIKMNHSLQQFISNIEIGQGGKKSIFVLRGFIPIQQTWKGVRTLLQILSKSFYIYTYI